MLRVVRRPCWNMLLQSLNVFSLKLFNLWIVLPQRISGKVMDLRKICKLNIPPPPILFITNNAVKCCSAAYLTQLAVVGMTVVGAILIWLLLLLINSSWNVVAHGDAQEGKRKGNWWMEWVTGTLHTTSEHGVSSITAADAHTSAASSQLNWRPPAGINGLVRFAKKRNLVSAHVPSHFNWPLQTFACSDPISDDSLRGCRIFQRMLGGKLVSVCTFGKRKKKVFFFPMFIAVFVERTTYFFFK